MERLDRDCRVLPKLSVGDSVLVQNQVGNHPSRWDNTGIIVEVKEYIVRVDGSGWMTLRNRKYLKMITPYTTGARAGANSTSPWASTGTGTQVPPLLLHQSQPQAQSLPQHQPHQPLYQSQHQTLQGDHRKLGMLQTGLR